MNIKQKIAIELKDILPHNVLNKVPSGFSLIGHVVILRFTNNVEEKYKKIIGEKLMSLDKRIKTVAEQKNTIETERKPIITLIAGENNFEVTHKEFGTRFYIDVEKLTFSPGNKHERGRMIVIAKENEIICDMFACVGNLSLAIAVKKNSIKVYAIEQNPVAFNYLKKNISANKVEDRYTAILGDNREVTPKNFADRVLMGYFDIDDEQFKNAVNSINKSGWIHYHLLASKEDLKNKKDIVFSFQKPYNFTIEEVKVLKVKKFSPRLIHYCMDILISKPNQN